MSAELQEMIVRYLAARRPDWQDLSISHLARIHGGASRETFRVRVRFADNGAAVERGLIFRRDPVSTLIETERSVEFAAYRAFHGTRVPVPEPLHLELDPIWLGRPFFVMEEIEGCTAASMLAGDPYGAHREAIGHQFWLILGEIAKADVQASGLTSILESPALDQIWQRELDRWAAVIETDEIEPQPIARAAIRWLRNHKPPAAQRLSVVHGDYRTGNFLFDGAGKIRAILDWEMAHLGDPLEDLAWAMDPLWSHHNPARPAGMIDRADAIRLWEQASGLKADQLALKWWSLFASLKGLAIWISSSNEFATGKNTDPVMAFSGWYCRAFHDKVIAGRLAQEAGA